MLATGIAALLSVAAPAGASAADTIVAETECCSFAAGPFSQTLGEIPGFENPAGADAVHNVTSTAPGPDGESLFRSETIPPGSTAPVEGSQYLGPGTYPFVCTLHGSSMSGELVVDGSSGSAAARPSVRLSIPAQGLKKVRRSGRLKVKVKAMTASTAVGIVVKRGRKSIASASDLSLSAGKTRTLKLKLGRAGKKAIEGGRRVAIVARATVPFGKPSSAKRKLR